MRYYFQDEGQKVATKCIRVSSTAATADVIQTLIEKFRPDIRMLYIPEYALYETHENGGTSCNRGRQPAQMHEYECEYEYLRDHGDKAAASSACPTLCHFFTFHSAFRSRFFELTTSHSPNVAYLSWFVAAEPPKGRLHFAGAEVLNDACNSHLLCKSFSLAAALALTFSRPRYTLQRA